MNAKVSYDQIIRQVYAMSRQRCLTELRQIERPRLDFTDEYLDELSLDALRHLLAAAFLQQHKKAHEPRRQ